MSTPHRSPIPSQEPSLASTTHSQDPAVRRIDRGATSVVNPPVFDFPGTPSFTLQEPSPEAKGSSDKRRAAAARNQASPLPTPRVPGAFQESPNKLKTPGFLHLDNSRPRSPLSKSTSVHDSDSAEDYFGSATHEPSKASHQHYAPRVPSGIMSRRKLWVKRPNASATLVKINEDDLVDEVRDLIITKYANSLGRSFDAPDVTLRIIPRERSQQSTERTLGPDESMIRALEVYYPGGQMMDEALIIDIPAPQRRVTPRLSPRLPLHTPIYEDHRPVEHGTEYFPPMPATSPGLSHSNGTHEGRPHSMAILETGQLPPLPSPQVREKRRGRPNFGRTQTTSPIVNGNSHASHNSSGISHTPRNRPRMGSIGESRHPSNVPAPPPLPTPPATNMSSETVIAKASTPPLDRAASPRLPKTKRTRKQPAPETVQDRAPNVFLAAGILDASVPPINILIVEDNIINLKLLEAFVKRLKVRWATAMNGRDAVTKWRGGGFHLVLMDIQMPIMNGLEATKEMRRLERVNGIGVFAKGDGEDRVGTSKANGLGLDNGSADDTTVDGVNSDDKLTGSFKSPVIIVALTASSLQSDRHEALAAGCNDFLTKPVNYVWLERKIMEWGCMQALIDFDGWRQWKAYAATGTDGAGDGPEKGKGKGKEKKELDPVAAKAKRDKMAAILAKMGQS